MPLTSILLKFVQLPWPLAHYQLHLVELRVAATKELTRDEHIDFIGLITPREENLTHYDSYYSPKRVEIYRKKLRPLLTGPAQRLARPPSFRNSPPI